MKKVLASLCLISLASPASAACQWPAWESFKRGFIENGRVIDRSDERAITTSEGQSYALFFALVAGDRTTFQRLVNWTQGNLSQGDFSKHLPAWLWGRAENGNFQILDDNAASDADLWIAYSLQEASRLWRIHHYQTLSNRLLQQVEKQEVARIEGLGPMLLPAPVGFTDEDSWTLNPSYTPLFLLSSFAYKHPEGPWQGMVAPTLRLLNETAPKGFAPDWIDWRSGAWHGSERSNWQGSYNAIRVYLWAGMQAPGSAGRDSLLSRFQPMQTYVSQRGYPPEEVNAETGTTQNRGPLGFSAAVLPLLASLGDKAALDAQLTRLKQEPLEADAYYGNVLSLFGRGWQEGRFRFNVHGELQLPDNAACPR
ncbi:cellulose synthase complex periplasmic endoglucanase BcsZ [Pseudomonas sp.]|uniref:cellulose synthase complex periplasmic endoglucanase BcsZ n=1 Tax=Pseudomonas sp. TaxID=306 RepID=UPI0028AC4FF2|nr:cellulose synthase complex periplasmic endoglucanase BcsZ [Pseudomonas sp.]